MPHSQQNRQDRLDGCCSSDADSYHSSTVFEVPPKLARRWAIADCERFVRSADQLAVALDEARDCRDLNTTRRIEHCLERLWPPPDDVEVAAERQRHRGLRTAPDP